MRPPSLRAGRTGPLAAGLALALVGTAHLPATAPAGPLTARTIVVRMGDDMKFSPARITIAPGDTVEWVVAGAVPHTVTDAPGKAALREHTILPAGAAPWDSGLLEQGKRYRQVFPVRGSYAYVCLLHEATGMVGHLVVR